MVCFEVFPGNVFKELFWGVLEDSAALINESLSDENTCNILWVHIESVFLEYFEGVVEISV